MATLLIIDGGKEIVRAEIGCVDPRRATALVWGALAGEPTPRKIRSDKGIRRGPRQKKPSPASPQQELAA